MGDLDKDLGIGDATLAEAATAIASGGLKVPKDWYLAIRRIVERDLPHCKALAMRVDRLEPGLVTVSMPYDDRLIGDPDTGVLHGGAITTLIDTAVGMVSLGMQELPRAVATLDLRIDHLRPSTPGERLVADAECVRNARSVVFVRAQAHHGDPSEPVAAAAATFMIGSTGFTPPAGEETS